jgi:hypothetical protein
VLWCWWFDGIPGLLILLGRQVLVELAPCFKFFWKKRTKGKIRRWFVILRGRNLGILHPTTFDITDQCTNYRCLYQQ